MVRAVKLHYLSIIMYDMHDLSLPQHQSLPRAWTHMARQRPYEPWVRVNQYTVPVDSMFYPDLSLQSMGLLPTSEDALVKAVDPAVSGTCMQCNVMVGISDAM
jgi:hypothetical protein